MHHAATATSKQQYFISTVMNPDRGSKSRANMQDCANLYEEKSNTSHKPHTRHSECGANTLQIRVKPSNVCSPRQGAAIGQGAGIRWNILLLFAGSLPASE